jgi:plastocyanin
MRLPKLFLLLALVAIGLSTAFTACGGDSGDDSSASATETGSAPAESNATSGEDTTVPSGDAVRSAKVEIENFAYNPDPVTIEEGGKVIWINRDSAPHTATAEDGSFDTGTLDEGKLKSENFKEAGTYAYVCSIHPQMHGTVEVVAAG